MLRSARPNYSKGRLFIILRVEPPILCRPAAALVMTPERAVAGQRLSAVLHAELAVNVPQVETDGRFPQAYPVGSNPVGIAPPPHTHPFLLAARDHLFSWPAQAAGRKLRPCGD